MKERTATPVLVPLALAAVAVGIAGFGHARLFHRGYGAVEVVGPLFLLDAIGSAIVILLLIFGRPRLFGLGALTICVGALVSIYISHTSSFFNFSESGYDGRARLIVIAEIAATVLTVLATLIGLRVRPTRSSSSSWPTP